MKKLITILMTLMLVAILTGLTGCGKTVPAGTKGRVKTRSGWADKTLKPGRHTCYGFDKMHLAQSTQHAYSEEMKILVGGKVNLTIEVQVRCSLNPNEKIQLNIFNDVPTDMEMDGTPAISNKAIYDTFLKMKVQSIPREIIGSKPDIKTVVASRAEIGASVKKRIMEESEATPLIVSAVEITNYDWPLTITNAQEKLAEIQLGEEQEQAKIRAALAKADGELKIAEKDKLVEMKKAEAVAESIRIIREMLAGAPEYLKWHEIRMLSEAANGPNNSFILVPYGQDITPMVHNAQLKQMLDKVPAVPATE